MLDLVLAVLHHLLVFGLFGVIVAELALVRPAITGDDLVRVARIDLCYGVLAGAILVVGFGRAAFAAKGWDYYSNNLYFQLKLSAFAAVGLLSVFPSVRILRWRRAAARDAAALPSAAEVATVRRFLWAEAALFPLIPAFAAAMARGYGA